VRDAYGVIAGGYGVHLKLAVVVGDGFAFPVGLFGLQQKMCAGNWAMLDIVNDAANGAKDSGVRSNSAQQESKNQNGLRT